MGFIDINASKWIPPAKMAKTAGTWTPAIASNVVSWDRGAADATFILLIPIDLPQGPNYHTGARLKSIDVYYDISVEAADGFATVEIEKVTLPANTVAPTGAAVSCTVDVDNDTTTERLAVAAHKMTVTPDADLWLQKGYGYYLNLGVDMGTNGVFKLMGLQANYELRV